MPTLLVNITKDHIAIMSVPIYSKTMHIDISKCKPTLDLTSGAGATLCIAQGHSHTSRNVFPLLSANTLLMNDAWLREGCGKLLLPAALLGSLIPRVITAVPHWNYCYHCCSVWLSRTPSWMALVFTASRNSFTQTEQVSLWHWKADWEDTDHQDSLATMVDHFFNSLPKRAP